MARLIMKIKAALNQIDQINQAPQKPNKYII